MEQRHLQGQDRCDEGLTEEMAKNVFNTGSIHEGAITRPQAIPISVDTVKQIVKDAGIDAAVERVGEPWPWIMQTQKVHLANGRTLLLKSGLRSDWTDASSILNQKTASELIRRAGINQPRVLFYSTDIDRYGVIFLLLESQRGTKLADVYYKLGESERCRLLRGVGRDYSRIHSITNDWAGIWLNGDLTKRKYPINPAQFYINAELQSGSTQYLVDKGIISKTLAKRVIANWNQNLEYLLNRPSSLIHVSPFPWTIYVDLGDDGGTITGLGALGDVMWGDPMIDVAHLFYPPFASLTDQEQQCFTEGYRLPVNDKAVDLYRILHTLCAMAGCYLAPVEAKWASTWTSRKLIHLDNLLQKLEG